MDINLVGTKYIKKIYLRAQSADPSPPLGTVLGNIGVNASNFCTLFNNRTKNLPSYLALKTTIYVYHNKTIDFTVSLPSTSFFLNAIRFEKTIKVFVGDRFNDKIILCVELYAVLQLAKLKFSNYSLKKAFGIILGTIKSMNLVIVK
jgi:large subunit ribosomal protein L11